MHPRNRAPSTLGEILVEDFLKPKKMTQARLAKLMGVPLQRINLLVNNKRGVTAVTALLLARVLKTTPEFWMNLQVNYDLWKARHEMDAHA